MYISSAELKKFLAKPEHVKGAGAVSSFGVYGHDSWRNEFKDAAQ